MEVKGNLSKLVRNALLKKRGQILFYFQAWRKLAKKIDEIGGKKKKKKNKREKNMVNQCIGRTISTSEYSDK
jgi:hypothetical protein